MDQTAASEPGDNQRVIARVTRADAKVATTIIARIEILRGRIEFARKDKGK